MKPIVQVDFCDFGRNFDKNDNFWMRLLRERFDVRLCDCADFVICSEFGHVHRLHTGVRIFVTGESTMPDWTRFDYAFTSHLLEDPRHLRLPFYVQYADPSVLTSKRPEDAEQILAGKTRFCSFIVSNHNPRKNSNRVDFFHRLSRYKRVDSGGRLLNNIGGPIQGWSAGKIEFLRSCKFNIAFENLSQPGYTTEKILEPMIARCLPVYWGNPQVGEEFNPRSFLNRHDFPDDEALVERIIELDRDDAKYLEYVRQPYFHNNQPNELFRRERLLDQFERIFFTPIRPVAQRRRWFQPGRWRLAKRDKVLTPPPIPGGRGFPS
jgi:hypothetical protein